jgi:hypothetical protein
MSRYKMEDEVIVDTEKAAHEWEEAQDWDGRNNISRATGDQWLHQRLYRSQKGRYYLVHTSQWEGSRDSAEWVTPKEATRWLLHNDHDLPEDLKQFAKEVCE